MATLNDDLVLEVISWLPLKDAVRCKILDKNFNRYVSNQSFEHKHFVRSNQKISNLLYCSNLNPTKFSQLQLENPYPLNNLKIMNNPPFLFASCGGILLLYYKHRSYFVINPIKGEFNFVQEDKHDGWVVGSVGLAVDSNTHSYRVRLVFVHISKHRNCLENQMCRFTIYNFCSSQWEERNEEDFVCKSSGFLGRNIQPVYLHNSLHWLREDGSILSFDVEKRRARIFQGPVKLIFGTRYGYDIWFGGVGDSLVFVCPSKYETVIYVYDLVHTKTWKIWHRIGNISLTGKNDYKNGFPIIFDGQRLVLLLRNKDGGDGEIFMHNILEKSWEKMGIVSATTEFVPFVSTLAKINSGYVFDELRNNFHLN